MPNLTAAVVPQQTLAGRWWSLANMMLTCLCDELASATLGGPVCRCSLMPGQIPIADVCQKVVGGGDGQAWIRLTNTFLTQQYPVPIAAMSCSANLTHAATFEAGVLRCAATLDAQGEPPTGQQLADDAAKVFDDMATLRNLDCCLPGKFKPMSGLWTPLSGGGCTGGSITITVLMANGPI